MIDKSSDLCRWFDLKFEFYRSVIEVTIPDGGVVQLYTYAWHYRAQITGETDKLPGRCWHLAGDAATRAAVLFMKARLDSSGLTADNDIAGL